MPQQPPSEQEFEEAYQKVLADSKKFGTQLSEKDFNTRIMRAINEKSGPGFEGNRAPVGEELNPRVAFGNRYGSEMLENAKEFGKGALSVIDPRTYWNAAVAKDTEARKFNKIEDPATRTAAQMADRMPEGPQQPVTPEPIDRQASRLAGGTVAGMGVAAAVPHVPNAVATAGRNLEATFQPIHPTGPIGAVTKAGTRVVGQLMQRAAPEAMSPEAAMTTDNLAQQRTVKMTPNTPATIPAEDAMGRALAEERTARASQLPTAAEARSTQKAGQDIHRFSEDVRSNVDKNINKVMRDASGRDAEVLGSIDEASAQESQQAGRRRATNAREERSLSAAEGRADADYARSQERFGADVQRGVERGTNRAVAQGQTRMKGDLASVDEAVSDEASRAARRRSQSASSERSLGQAEQRADQQWNARSVDEDPLLLESTLNKLRETPGDVTPETLPSTPETKGEPITRPGMKGQPRRVTGYKTEQPPRNEAQYDTQQAEPATGAGPQRRQNAWSPEVTPDDLLSEDVATKLTGAPDTAAPEATAAPTSVGSTPLDPHHPQTYKAYVDASKAAGQSPVGMSEWSYSQEDNGFMDWKSGYPKGSLESQQARRLHISNAEDRALTRPERKSQDLGDATEDLARRLKRGTP